MLHDGQFERDKVFIVYPVLGRTAHKGVLGSTGTRVALYRVAAVAYEVEKFGEFENEVIIVHAVERVLFEVVFVECLFEPPAGYFLYRQLSIGDAGGG